MGRGKPCLALRGITRSVNTDAMRMWPRMLAWVQSSFSLSPRLQGEGKELWSCGSLNYLIPQDAEILRVEFWMLDFQQPHLQSLWNTLRLLHVFTTVFWRIRSRALGWERGIRVGECKLVCPHSTVVWAWHVLLYQVQCRKKVAHRC